MIINIYKGYISLSIWLYLIKDVEKRDKYRINAYYAFPYV